MQVAEGFLLEVLRVVPGGKLGHGASVKSIRSSDWAPRLPLLS